MLNIIIIQRNW